MKCRNKYEIGRALVEAENSQPLHQGKPDDESETFAPCGYGELLLNTERMTNIAITFFKGTNINRDFHNGTDIVVALWRVFIDKIAMARGILDSIGYNLCVGIVPCRNRSSSAIGDFAENIKTGQLDSLGRNGYRIHIPMTIHRRRLLYRAGIVGALC